MSYEGDPKHYEGRPLFPEQYQLRGEFTSLEGERFRGGVEWADLPINSGMTVKRDDRLVGVSVFGLQRLMTADSAVVRHRENDMDEWVYPLEGEAVMTIDNGLDCSRGRWREVGLMGVFGRTEEWWREVFRFDDRGRMLVAGKVIEPVITRRGDWHGTNGGPLTYVVIKGVPMFGEDRDRSHWLGWGLV